VERFRIRFGEGRPWNRIGVPMMGFGFFVMMRKQMLGIRDRVERSSTPVEEVVATA
jgi:hypothetical protein